jgi:hypothetical protein
VAPPVFDHDLCLLHCIENFAIEQLAAQFAVEAFAITFFPRAPRFDVGGLGADGSNPVAKSNRNELRAIVRSYERRYSRETNSSQSASMTSVALFMLS